MTTMTMMPVIEGRRKRRKKTRPLRFHATRHHHRLKCREKKFENMKEATRYEGEEVLPHLRPIILDQPRSYLRTRLDCQADFSNEEVVHERILNKGTLNKTGSYIPSTLSIMTCSKIQSKCSERGVCGGTAAQPGLWDRWERIGALGCCAAWPQFSFFGMMQGRREWGLMDGWMDDDGPGGLVHLFRGSEKAMDVGGSVRGLHVGVGERSSFSRFTRVLDSLERR